MESRLLDRFGWLLLFVLASIAGQALIDTSHTYVGSSLSHAISGLELVVAVRVAGVTRRWRRTVDFLVLLVVTSNILLVLMPHLPGAVTLRPARLQPDVLWLLAAAVLPIIVARRLIEHRVVGLATVLGAVAAYLQIAVAYASAYQALDALTAPDIFGHPEPSTSYMYFSLVTMTTVGYGDLTPVSEAARLLAVSEAVIGQVFLVTFVAMIVSRFDAAR